MDFLNKTFAQAADLFRSMTAGARITAVLLLVLIVVSVGYLVRSHVGSADSYLMNGEIFPASQLNAMIAAFGDANLQGYQFDGNRIRVPRGQESKYMAALAAKGALPHDPLDYLEKALEDNPFLTDRHQREAKLLQMKQRHSEIITAMPGIEKAHVFLDAGEKTGYLKEKDKTASVSVKAQGTTALNEAQVASIRQFVATSVAGLKYEKVGLTDINSQRTYSGDAENPASVMDDAYRARRRWDEKELEEKIQRTLADIPGVRVAVAVTLDKEQMRRETELKHDPKTVPIQTMEKNRTRANEGTGTAAPAGFTANQPAALAPAKSKGSKEDEDESERHETMAVGGTQTEKVTVGMTPTRVAVTVSVPTSYFEQVWRERNRPDAGGQAKTPTAADLDQIRTQTFTEIKKQVATLLPAVPGVTDLTELVSVGSLQSITPAPIPEPQVKEQVLGWLGQYWSTLGLMLLGLVSLVMLRSMVRSVPPAERSAPPPAAAAQESKADEEAESAEAAKQRRLKRLAVGGPSLRDEVSLLVSEDPDAAANILRNWIGNSS